MRIVYALLSLMVLGLLAAGGVIVWALDHFGRDLPDYSQLADYEPPVVTRVHAGDGRLLAEFATEKRVFVPVEAMPKLVVRAFVSAEDQNFYRHPGVDFVALARAMVSNVGRFMNDERLVGASTITQQVARNFLLTNERRVERKVREMILAFRIEKALPKDRILELYLNEIYLGNRSYGVAAAAQNYFGKSLDELTVAEAAFLAALPKAPDRYHRPQYRELATDRRNYVIDRMLEDGYVTAEEAAAAKAEPIAFRRRSEAEYVVADYFAEEVRRRLAERYGESMLYESGLTVRTTLDPRLQDVATRALRDGLMAYDRRHGWRGPVARIEDLAGWPAKLAAVPFPPGGEAWRLAVVLDADDAAAEIGFADGSRGRIPLEELRWARAWREGERLGPEIARPSDAVAAGDVVLVEAVAADPEGKAYPEDSYALRQIPAVQGGLVALDPHTGRVLAMSGGFSHRISVFNRATQALRQPGSAFKPFVYLAALDNGFTPSSLIMDAPFEIEQGPGLPLWKPQNYSNEFYGPTPLRVGIEKSRNVMTVRLAHQIGMPTIAEYAERFGIVDDLPEVLSMSLGAGETTVLRLTTAYAMLVNGGRRIEPTFVERIQDRNGRTLFRRDERACDGCRDVAWGEGAEVPELPDPRERVADPRTAYQIVSMLEGVVQRGTATRLKAIGKPLAGKTGTTNDSMDAWFVGFTPDLVVGTYVGFDQPRPLGDRETGSSVAVPVFEAFMAEALKDEPGTPFRVPPGVRLVRVNPETGRLAAPGDRNSIWEPFIPGTEPTGTETVLDGSMGGGYAIPANSAQPPAAGGAAPPTSAPAATMGTGGLY